MATIEITQNVNEDLLVSRLSSTESEQDEDMEEEFADAFEDNED